MLVAEVRGKSTRQIRPVHVLIDEVMAKGIEMLMTGHQSKEGFIIRK